MNELFLFWMGCALQINAKFFVIIFTWFKSQSAFIFLVFFRFGPSFKLSTLCHQCIEFSVADRGCLSRIHKFPISDPVFRVAFQQKTKEKILLSVVPFLPVCGSESLKCGSGSSSKIIQNCDHLCLDPQGLLLEPPRLHFVCSLFSTAPFWAS
jgi:hypothetical protein